MDFSSSSEGVLDILPVEDENAHGDSGIKNYEERMID
jgi:hypothetical protein